MTLRFNKDLHVLISHTTSGLPTLRLVVPVIRNKLLTMEKLKAIGSDIRKMLLTLKFVLKKNSFQNLVLLYVTK